MMRCRTLAWLCAGLLLSMGCSGSNNGNQNNSDVGGDPSDAAGIDAGGGDQGMAQVDLTGAVAKGPFVLGSTVNVSPVDGSGAPTGDVFNTQTTSDLGEFEVLLTYAGLVSLEGAGFYYNEATGVLSDAELTLRAYADVQAGTEDAYVNIITHLSYNRIKKLLEDGSDFVTARDQAEGELRTALGIGPDGFDPNASGTDMNVLGGDNDANAYVFAVSSVVAQAAQMRTESGSGSVDANLQELLNQLSLDLSDDGQLQANRTDELAAAETEIDTSHFEAMLQRRLDELGSSAVVPDLDRIIDSDGDDVPNASDNCIYVANPNQAAVDEICSYSTVPVADSDIASLSRWLAADFDGDADTDLLVLSAGGEGEGGSSLRLAVQGADGSLVLGEPQSAGLPSGDGSEPRSLDLVDYDGDGDVDVAGVMKQSFEDPGPSVLLNDGSGTFSYTSLGVPNTIDVGGFDFSSVTHGVTVDLNDDGNRDLVTIHGNSTLLSIVIADGSGGWETPVLAPLDFSGIDRVFELLTGDVDADGDEDVIFATGDASLVADGIVVLLNNGTATPSVEGPFSEGFNNISLRQLEVGDFDGDSHADLLAVALAGGEQGGSATGYLSSGDGSGTFGAASQAMMASASNPLPLFGDFNGDGIRDVVVLPRGSDEKGSVFFGTTSGLEQKSDLRLPGDLQLANALATDVDGDGITDLVLHGGIGDGSTQMRVLLVNQ